MATLNKWVERKGDEATYLNLMTACHELENTQMIDLILDQLKEEKETKDEGLDSDSCDPVKAEDMRFLCGCGKCSLHDFLRNGCPNPWGNSVFPLLHIEAISIRNKLSLFSRLQDEAESVRRQFASLSVKVCDAFKEQYSNNSEVVDKLAVYILSQQPYTCIETEKQVELKSSLSKSNTIFQVMKLLTDGFITWFNHALLGFIAEEFKIAVTEYHDYVEKHLKPYLQRSLFEIPTDSFTSGSTIRSGEFLLKIDLPSPRPVLKGSLILSLRARVASTLGIAIDAFEICSYDKGCVQFKVAAPSPLLEGMFPLPLTDLNALGSAFGDCTDLKIRAISYSDNYQVLPEEQKGSLKYSLTSYQEDTNFSTPLTIVDKMFASLVVEIISSIKSSEVKLEMLKQFIFELQTQNSKAKSRQQPFLKPIISEIEGASTAKDLIFVLNEYWSFFNYELLEYMLNHIGNKDAKKKLHLYLECLKALRVAELPVLLHPVNEVKGFCPDVVHVITKPIFLQCARTADLLQIHKTLANILQLEVYAILLRQIHKNSCQLDFLIAQGAEEYIPKITNLELSSLSKVGVVQIGINDINRYPLISEYSVELIIVGDAGVGKTSILHQFVNEDFRVHNIKPTIGVALYRTYFDMAEKRVELKIWDTSGEERFFSVTPNYYRRAHGVLLVYDITRRKTKERLNHWLYEIRQHCREDPVIILIGNKNDLNSERMVEYDEGLQYATNEGLLFAETSAKSYEDLHKAFQTLVGRTCSLVDSCPYDNKDNVQVADPQDTIKQKKGCC